MNMIVTSIYLFIYLIYLFFAVEKRIEEADKKARLQDNSIREKEARAKRTDFTSR